MANWVIDGSKWFEPVTQMLWKYSYKEPVLNADETTSRTLKTDKGKKIDKLGQMWICSTGRAAKKKIAIYEYRDSRTKAVAEELYYGYTGILQTDGLQSYGSAAATQESAADRTLGGNLLTVYSKSTKRAKLLSLWV